MLAASAVVIMRRCTSEMRPCGNSTTTSTWLRPRNASTAAPPVSPEVATTMVRRSPRAASTWSISRASSCIADVLEGQRRAVEQLQREGIRAELDKRRHRGMAEGAVGLARHAGEVGFGDGIGGELPDHLDGDLGVGRPAKPAIVFGSSRGQASGT